MFRMNPIPQHGTIGAMYIIGRGPRRPRPYNRQRRSRRQSPPPHRGSPPLVHFCAHRFCTTRRKTIPKPMKYERFSTCGRAAEQFGSVATIFDSKYFLRWYPPRWCIFAHSIFRRPTQNCRALRAASYMLVDMKMLRSLRPASL